MAPRKKTKKETATNKLFKQSKVVLQKLQTNKTLKNVPTVLKVAVSNKVKPMAKPLAQNLKEKPVNKMTKKNNAAKPKRGRPKRETLKINKTVKKIKNYEEMGKQIEQQLCDTNISDKESEASVDSFNWAKESLSTSSDVTCQTVSSKYTLKNLKQLKITLNNICPTNKRKIVNETTSPCSDSIQSIDTHIRKKLKPLQLSSSSDSSSSSSSETSECVDTQNLEEIAKMFNSIDLSFLDMFDEYIDSCKVHTIKLLPFKEKKVYEDLKNIQVCIANNEKTVHLNKTNSTICNVTSKPLEENNNIKEVSVEDNLNDNVIEDDRDDVISLFTECLRSEISAVESSKIIRQTKDADLFKKPVSVHENPGIDFYKSRRNPIFSDNLAFNILDSAHLEESSVLKYKSMKELMGNIKGPPVINLNGRTVCSNNFASNVCPYRTCYFRHVHVSTMELKNKLESFDDQKIAHTYIYLKRHKVNFAKYLPVFVEIACDRNFQLHIIIEIIRDIINCQHPDRYAMLNKCLSMFIHVDLTEFQEILVRQNFCHTVIDALFNITHRNPELISLLVKLSNLSKNNNLRVSVPIAANAVSYLLNNVLDPLQFSDIYLNIIKNSDVMYHTPQQTLLQLYQKCLDLRMFAYVEEINKYINKHQSLQCDINKNWSANNFKSNLQYDINSNWPANNGKIDYYNNETGMYRKSINGRNRGYFNGIRPLMCTDLRTFNFRPPCVQQRNTLN